MRIIVAPQEFKGSLTAVEAAHALAEGVREARRDAVVIEAPVSDGGAGLVDALVTALDGATVSTDVHDPLMRPVTARWGLSPEGVAAIEMAAASGLVLLRPKERDPLHATTYGTGELIAAALDGGCSEVIVGVGGSATVDAGAGAAQALGASLLDASGSELQRGGAALARLDRIDLSGVDARVRAVRLRVAADVTNVLCGPLGAAAVYGPQKGASAEDVKTLDAALARFASIVERDCGVPVAGLVGGGAAGGLAAGMAAMLGASIEPGFDVVAGAMGLEALMRGADLVITGEGRLDRQTGFGKAPQRVAEMARAAGARAVVIAGSVGDEFDMAQSPFDVVISLSERAGSVEAARTDAAALVRSAAMDAVRGAG